MKINTEFSNLMKKVNNIDKKYRKLYKEKCFTSNPFSFTCGQTYAWVEDEDMKNKDKESEVNDNEEIL